MSPAKCRAELPDGVPPVPPEAESFTSNDRRQFTVYDHGPYRWRFNPRGLHTFIEYVDGGPSKGGSIGRIIHGSGYEVKK